jgi:PBP1b-binding outer membrane lipoprotein LpoB
MKNINKKYTYFLLSALLLLGLVFITNKKNSHTESTQKPQDEILSENTLKEIDSLNSSIDSLTIKNNIKFGRVVETEKH